MKIYSAIFVCVLLLTFASALNLALHATNGNKALTARFLEAAQNADVAAAKRLLDRGANVNAKDAAGATALHNAIRPSYEGGTSMPLVRLLLSRRANVNVSDSLGQTPLMAAAALGDFPLVKMLLARGARVNAEDKNGQTPLMYA
ncbi:MAG: ankyrin repeat domain-containing protein, partial [Armatimonadetes bacterium]|nr:ankyrin repeat domain-containing protein [Armatimonadota bacterium]